MPKPVIVVIGATGNQGGSVIEAFLPESPNWHIRAVTRDPSSAKAQALASKGCEVVQADTGDVSSLITAFAGATAIFAVTDYWAPFWNSDVRRRLQPGQSIRTYCCDEEIRHGTNMAKAAATTLDSLTHYIWSCTSSPRKWSMGKYNDIHHFESKAAVTDYINEKEPSLAARMSTIQVSFYASNVYTFASMRPQKVRFVAISDPLPAALTSIQKSDGTYTIDRLTQPNKKHPFIVTQWDTGHFVKTLIESPPGKTLLAYTAMISFRQVAEMWSRATGQKAVYRQCTLKELQDKFPDEGEEGTMSDMYSSDFGYSGGDPACLEPNDLGINERPDVIERWLNQADWDAVMGEDWRT